MDSASRMELRRKRFASTEEVLVPKNPSQRKINTKVVEEYFEIDIEGDNRADGRHILKPTVEPITQVSYRNITLDEVISLRKTKAELKEDLDSMELCTANENESLEDIIKRTKLIAARRSAVAQVFDDTPYDPNVSLDAVIKSEKFKRMNSSVLARLEQDKKEKVILEEDDLPTKRGRSETLEERWEQVNFSTKLGYDANTLDSMNANGVSMDALKVLEVLAGAGNRIKILIYNVKDIEAEKEAAGGNWIAQRWLVEIFLVGMDETGSEIAYKTMGIGAANKKLLAKYAAAEDLFFNLKKTNYVTNFPRYFIPIVHRLSVTVHEQVIQFLEKSFPEGYDAALNIKVVVNDKEKDEPYFACSFIVNETVISEVTHMNEDHAELLAMYRGFEALTGTKYEAEGYLKGHKVDADLSRYRLVDTQAKTVATVPFEILSQAAQTCIKNRQAHRNTILTKKFSLHQDVEKRNMTEEEMNNILTVMSQCNLNGKDNLESNEDFELESSCLDEDDENDVVEIVETLVDDDMQEIESVHKIIRRLGSNDEDSD